MDIKINDSNCIENINKEYFKTDIQFTLSPYYKERLVLLCKENRIEESEGLRLLLDYYWLDNAIMMQLLSKKLRYRLSKGVNRFFLIYLRTLYTIIGHFLKRIRYI